jgi:hypothetical protein
MTSATATRAPSVTASRPKVNELLRYGAIAGCAASAGVHIGIIPAHVDEGAIAEVAAFAASSAVLAVLALLVSDARWDTWAPAAAATFLGAVAVAYLLSRTVGLPWIVTDPEPFHLTGLVTVAAELTSAAAGIALFLRTRKDHQ